MSFKVIFRSVLILIILFVMLYVGMNNRQAIEFSFPLYRDKPLIAAAGLIFFGIFAVGFLAGTTAMTAGGGKKSSGGSRDQLGFESPSQIVADDGRRDRGIERFGSAVIRNGQPLSHEGAHGGRETTALAADHDHRIRYRRHRVDVGASQVAAQDRHAAAPSAAARSTACTGTRAKDPMLALMTLEEKRSAQSVPRSTWSMPNQSAMRTSVPTLPGSWTPSSASVRPRSSAAGGQQRRGAGPGRPRRHGRGRGKMADAGRISSSTESDACSNAPVQAGVA